MLVETERRGKLVAKGGDDDSGADDEADGAPKRGRKKMADPKKAPRVASDSPGSKGVLRASYAGAPFPPAVGPGMSPFGYAPAPSPFVAGRSGMLMGASADPLTDLRQRVANMELQSAKGRRAGSRASSRGSSKGNRGVGAW